tara:strand:- start:14582 stop:15037 length:456 start_codon:yes stop_codon:yes gene_type:complete
MEQIFSTMKITTKGEGFIDITKNLNKFLKDNNLSSGILILSSLHTSCSLIINENADPKVLIDLQNYIKAIVPFNSYQDLKQNKKEIYYEHYEEGEDDMPAHIKTALTNTSLSLSFKDEKLILGIWQAIYLWEHRFGEKIRTLNIHIIGERI